VTGQPASRRTTALGIESAVATTREHRVQLLASLFRHYDRDEEFGDALIRLIPLAESADIIHLMSPSTRSPDPVFQLAETVPGGGHDPRFAQVRSFIAAVDSLGGAYGLDRLGQDGRAQIVAWCDRFVRAHGSGSVAPGAYDQHRLSTARTWFGFEPQVVGVIEPPWRRERWELTRETRQEARQRLERIAREHIRLALDQIEAGLAETGRVLPRAIPKLERDVGWLYRKLRHRESYQEIFNACVPPPAGGVETVRKAVLRVAARLKVDASGWEPGWR
jgi:hypothetical protein